MKHPTLLSEIQLDPNDYLKWYDYIVIFFGQWVCFFLNERITSI